MLHECNFCHSVDSVRYLKHVQLGPNHEVYSDQEQQPPVDLQPRDNHYHDRKSHQAAHQHPKLIIA